MVDPQISQRIEGLRQRRKGSCSPTNSVISCSEESDTEEDKEPIKPPKPTYHQPGKDKTILDKLFSSNEENNVFIPHIHKTLGLSCLISFAYRFSYRGAADCNFGPTVGTLLFVLLHWSLHASSFIFAIPQKRIRDGGYRIWPEMRIHAMVFASRHFAFILLRWYEEKNNLHSGSPDCLWHMDIIIVLATCALADLASYSQGSNRSRTIRDAVGSFGDPYEQWFASQMQIFLTAFCLVGYRRYTLHLVALFVIQVNAFLMTLRRKNVASHAVLIGAYGLLLVFGFVVIGMDDAYSKRVGIPVTFGAVATILRMGPLQVNKYVLWTGLGLAWWYIRTSGTLGFYNTPFWVTAHVITLQLAGLFGWHKRSKAPPEKRNSVVGYGVFAFHFGTLLWVLVLNFVNRR